MLSSVQVAAFVKEAAGIAKKKREQALYSPAVAAHEAGHAYLHRNPQSKNEKRKFDVMGAAEIAAPLAAGGFLAARMAIKNKAPTTNELIAATAVSQLPRLIDEYGSSIKGYSQLKRSKVMEKLSPKDIKRERNRLISAGGTYTAGTAAALAAAADAPALRVAAIGTGLGAATHMALSKGPKITAQEAKKLVHEISPGVGVYTSNSPIAGGSLYVSPSKNRLKKFLVDHQLRPYLSDKDRKEVVRHGGVLLAPINKGTLVRGFLGTVPSPDERFKKVK